MLALAEDQPQLAPMRIAREGELLIVRDTPGCFWVFGLWFVAGGVLALSLPWIASDAAALSTHQRLVAVLVGLGVAAGGVSVLVQSPLVQVELDRRSGAGVHRMRDVVRSSETHFRADDVAAVELLLDRDSDGDRIFHLRLRLRDGRALPLHAQPRRDEPAMQGLAAKLRAELGLPPSTAVMSIFEGSRDLS